jgi:hypothetical protein
VQVKLFTTFHLHKSLGERWILIFLKLFHFQFGLESDTANESSQFGIGSVSANEKTGLYSAHAQVLNLFRVDEDSELNGLDTVELGEPAYPIGTKNISSISEVDNDLVWHIQLFWCLPLQYMIISFKLIVKYCIAVFLCVGKAGGEAQMTKNGLDKSHNLKFK